MHRAAWVSPMNVPASALPQEPDLPATLPAGFGTAASFPGPVRGCPCDGPPGSLRPRTYSGQRRRGEADPVVFVQVMAMWRGAEERSVKPSAQPTLVRTQHLPPPAKTARWLRKRGPVGRSLLVTACISVRHCGSMRSSGYGHIADRVRAERAVRITARFADPRRFCPIILWGSKTGRRLLTCEYDCGSHPRAGSIGGL
jgi:hypothetical protein